MASITYDKIFSYFLGDITDYNLYNLSQSDAEMLMTEYLHKAMAESYVNRLFSKYTLSDDVQTLEYEMIHVVGDDQDEEFVATAIAKWMVYEWLKRQVKSVTNTAQMFAGKEQKMYSQAQHLSELRSLQDDAFKEARFYLQDRGYIYNDYLGT